MIRTENTFNSSIALDIDLEIIWSNEYKYDHHISIVQLPPWPKEWVFMVIYLILCVVLEKWFVTWKNIKPRSCPLYPPNPGRNQAENILNHINKVFCDISRVLLTLGGVCNGFKPFWHFFYYIRLFRALRRFLGAIKIATESWECILSDYKFWSTGVDFLVNIWIPAGLNYIAL